MRPGRNPSVWRDLGLAVALAATSGVIAARFDLHESVFSWTRRWEWLQLDEFPVALLVFALCLAVMNARRLMDLRGLLRENRLLAQRALAVQEAERKHLARELHDELGQYLNAIKLDAVSISDSGGDAPVSTGASLAIIRSVDHVHRAVSDMIGRLRPVGLDELGLVDAIEHCVDHWRQRLPEMQFELSVSGSFDGLSEPATLTVYRLIQEGLTNIYK